MSLFVTRIVELSKCWVPLLMLRRLYDLADEFPSLREKFFAEIRRIEEEEERRRGADPNWVRPIFPIPLKKILPSESLGSSHRPADRHTFEGGMDERASSPAGAGPSGRSGSSDHDQSRQAEGVGPSPFSVF